MAGKPLTLDQARAALFGKGSIMKEINHANSERGILRQEMGFSEYDLGKHVKDKKQKAELQALGRAMDRDFSIGRVLEKLSGQVVGGTRSVNESGTDKKGLSAGENILGLYKQTLEGNRDLLNRYSMLFYNLVDSRSQLYDKGFADAIRKNEALAKKLGLLDSSGKPLDANTSGLAKGADGKPSFIGLEAYNALMERGFRFTDLKRGLSINMRSEGGAIPMIEWKPEFLKAKGKDGTYSDRGGIWLKAEHNDGKTYVPELGGVYARTPGSFYSTRPTGASLLINVNGKWQYGDPNKAWMGQVYGVAEKQIGLRQNISLALVGFDEKASKAAGLDAKSKAFDPSQATYRVIPTAHLVANRKSDWKGIFKPLTYSNKTDSDIFDSLSRSDLLRGKLRSGLYTAGMGLGEWMNSSLIHRMDRMNAWYDAQLQVRLALKARADETGSWMTSGKERYSILTGTIDEDGKKGQSALDAVFHKGKESLLESSGISPSKSETVESKLRNAAARLEHGDDTMLGNMRAAYYNWKRNISQQTLSEIAGEEAKWYSAKTTLAALEKTGKNGLGLTSSQYERLHDNLSSQVDGFKAAYKEAKKDYGAISKMEIGWVGSHGNIYTPQRNLMTMGPLSYLLGSRYVAGSFQDFYNIVESSVMRDPRVAIGAGAPGFDWTFYVGYHTGQNVYERAHFWATNSIWERNMLMPLGLAYPIHKWWNDKVSFASRISSGYTSPIAGDMLYAPHHQQANYLAWAAFPFQSKTYSDFWRARRQSIVDFTGLGAAVGAFQSTGSSTRGDENRGLLRTLLDRFGDTSEHYYDNPYRLSSMQRYDDQLSISKFKKAEQFFEKNKGNPDYKVEVDGRQKTLGEATEMMQSAFDRGEEEKGQEYRKAIGDMLYGYLNAKDKRGVFVRNMFSGDDMASDGSRGRFLEMYCVFHSNVWNPTVPGMFTADPLTGEWHGFARNQRRVLEAPENSHLSKMANYYIPEIDLDTGKFKGMVNRFSTYEDAISQNYLEDTTALLQLAKRQNKALSYSAMNVMSTGFYNPFWGGLAKVGLKRLMSNTSWGSTLTDMPVKEGIYGGQENFDRLVGANTGYSFGELMPQGGHHGSHAGGSGGGDQWQKSGIRLRQQSNYIVRKGKSIISSLERRINVWDEENNIYHQRKRRTTMKQTEETSSSYVGETYEALRPFLQDLDE
jgi:hypothetical protein